MRIPGLKARVLSLSLLAAMGVATGCSSSSSSPAPLAEAPGCGSTKLFAVPDDPSAKGPWPVGVATVDIPITGGSIKTEIWYPAKLGSEAGKAPATYDIRAWLPESERSKVPDSATQNNFQTGCYPGLPIDDAHGPYPVVIFVHGTASFRIASITAMTQWASRGFIVVASDHPGLDLADELATFGFGACTPGTIAQDLNRDVDATIAALNAPTGDLAFLGTSLDMTRLAISGHSAGATAAAQMSTKPNVLVDIPLSDATEVSPSTTLKSVLILAGQSDTVIPYDRDQSAYESSPAPKRLVGIANTGHLAPTDLCGLKNTMGQDLLTLAQQYNVCGAVLGQVLWDCKSSYLDQDTTNLIVNYATTATLEETLHCSDRKAAFAQLQSKYPQVAEFKESM
jgi:acetyl esterase/lipase